jgi:tetratricopeptide (TPR) repeat protein
MQQNNLDEMVNRQLAIAMQLRRASRIDQAMELYAQVAAMAPLRTEPLLESGTVALDDGRFDEALYWFARAREIAPELPGALEGAGNALIALGRPVEALAMFEKMQSVDARSAASFHGAGEALKQLGRLAESRQAAERAAILAPDLPVYHYALAHCGRFKENDPRLTAMEKLAKNIASLPEGGQCELHFALAKACDDLGRREEAFAHWRAANAIRRRHVDYDEMMHFDMMRDLAAAFPAETMTARRGAGHMSEIPVFVVGMPRSGTTLVDQILASHPAVAGIGESMVLHLLLGQGLAGENFPARFAEVPDAALNKLGSLYVTRLRIDAPGALRIVDKLTANFMLCGLIHLALPKARIVHVRRDPLDTCFSCFANLFSRNIDYTYELGELGRYYRAYAALMRHWRAVLPPGAMIEVEYERLVADFEPEAKRIVDFCGLEWDERCLAFHRTERVVHTLSSVQVRQPLYRTAVGRAQPYRQWLGPLIEALGEDYRERTA